MLENVTKKKGIIGKVRLAKGPFERAKGLMFENLADFDYALVFILPVPSRLAASVHMMFVFFPIDIIFLDSGKKVVDKATLFPWQLNYTPKLSAKYFIELPEGCGAGISTGDKLEWESQKSK